MALMTAGFAAGGLMAPLAGMGPAHAAVAPATHPAATAPTAAVRSAETAATAGRRTGDAAGNPFCQGPGRKYQASPAAHAYCRGTQPHGPSGQFAHTPAAGKPVPGAPGNPVRFRRSHTA